MGYTLSDIKDDVLNWMKQGINVRFSGNHGIGKTHIIAWAAKQLGIKTKYFSAATLDPQAHLTGIPFPTEVSVSDSQGQTLKKRILEYIRPHYMETAELFIFDEVNRAHPLTVAALFEMVQFGAINGEKLPNFKMVWIAGNFDPRYQVMELDPAFLDRFEVHVQLDAEVSVDYYTSVGIGAETAKIAEEWWQGLDDEQKFHCSPRRLEYALRLLEKGVSLSYTMDKNSYPMATLRDKLKRLTDIPRIKSLLSSNPDSLAEEFKNPSSCISIANQIIKLEKEERWEVLEALAYMPKENLATILRNNPRIQSDLTKNGRKFPKLMKVVKSNPILNSSLTPTSNIKLGLVGHSKAVKSEEFTKPLYSGRRSRRHY